MRQAKRTECRVAWSQREWRHWGKDIGGEEQGWATIPGGGKGQGQPRGGPRGILGRGRCLQLGWKGRGGEWKGGLWSELGPSGQLSESGDPHWLMIKGSGWLYILLCKDVITGGCCGLSGSLFLQTAGDGHQCSFYEQAELSFLIPLTCLQPPPRQSKSWVSVLIMAPCLGLLCRENLLVPHTFAHRPDPRITVISTCAHTLGQC